MLTNHAKPLAQQRGAILLITLIALVAMTLSSIALIRSVDTGTTIAGNLGFQQAATYSAEAGIAAAHKWLDDHKIGTDLEADHLDEGYVAAGMIPSQVPSSGHSWGDFWADTLEDQAVALAKDAATGNTARYAIQRLCALAGASDAADCAKPPPSDKGGSKKAGMPPVTATSNQVYYRITVRIDGPRNTVNYVQAIIAM